MREADGLVPTAQAAQLRPHIAVRFQASSIIEHARPRLGALHYEGINEQFSQGSAPTCWYASSVRGLQLESGAHAMVPPSPESGMIRG